MKKVLLGLSVFLIPVFAFAQDPGENIEDLAESIGSIVGTLIPVVFALILLGFFWGLVKYIFAAGDEESKAQGKRIMVGGVIALFVAASIWGIVVWIQTTLGVDDEQEMKSPGVENLGGGGS